MKLIKVEYLFDSSKAIFYFSSEGRIDFRELVKNLASSFHTRIEMRQVGVRDEAKIVGGIGPCGRELCCASFSFEFRTGHGKDGQRSRICHLIPRRSLASAAGLCAASAMNTTHTAALKGCGKKKGKKGEPCSTDRPEAPTLLQARRGPNALRVEAEEIVRLVSKTVPREMERERSAPKSVRPYRPERSVPELPEKREKGRIRDGR